LKRYRLKIPARLQGILKRKPGEKSFAIQWAEHKREELALEERKFGRSAV
jgi:hypothetical protein